MWKNSVLNILLFIPLDFCCRRGRRAAPVGRRCGEGVSGTVLLPCQQTSSIITSNRKSLVQSHSFFTKHKHHIRFESIRISSSCFSSREILKIVLLNVSYLPPYFDSVFASALSWPPLPACPRWPSGFSTAAAIFRPRGGR